eukprot:TRINITY_DN4946_c0_g1_i1.p1 TRINITY_DN4946_c0_g1~~TRINITY_DN4946_c0_g1_i1.p1  ORF type:complete len:516 (+),score=144.63 TRINITY_DN4946_c0_g1_i1:135-1682(+)
MAWDPVDDHITCRDSRGWAMRKGRCKRLRHKEEGRESKRGRAAFSRSFGQSQSRQYCRWDLAREQRAACELRMWAMKDAVREYLDEREEEEDDAALAEVWVAEDEAEGTTEDSNLSFQQQQQQPEEVFTSRQLYSLAEETSVETTSGDVKKPSTAAEARCRPQLLRMRSVPVTTLERGMAQQRATTALVPMEAWSELQRKDDAAAATAGKAAATAVRKAYEKLYAPRRDCSRWELAIAQYDAAVAAAQDGGASAGAHADPIRKKRRLLRQSKTAPSAFGRLQQQILHLYRRQLTNSLRECFAGAINLEPVTPCAQVQQRFMAKCGQSFKSVLPTFHGTRSELHASICESGFLIPGKGNKLPVRNGSAHGLGVYTAGSHNAWLSRTFCNAPRMLVCGVVDDAKPVFPRTPCGNHWISAQSENVRHVGDAVVVFDEARVVPLFEATGGFFTDLTLETIREPLAACGWCNGLLRVCRLHTAAASSNSPAASRQPTSSESCRMVCGSAGIGNAAKASQR